MAATAGFSRFNLCESLLENLTKLKFDKPTEIQEKCLGPALEGRDIIGIAPTGSGKTVAFGLPILQQLWNNPQEYFACILSPTRELAYQISAQIDALGMSMGVRCVVIVGGDDDRVQQAIKLSKRPHVIVATPGRLVDHLKTTKGFNLRSLKFLVLDEADRLLNEDFQASVDDILRAIPEARSTYLFSATMTDSVAKLQRASLTNPVKIEVSSHKYATVASLLQYYILCPLPKKEATFMHLVNSLPGKSIIVFTRTVNQAQRLALLLRSLDFKAVPLHGELSQSQRLGAFNKFKSRACNILVATDLASRGLDVPSVDMVINYDCPTNTKDYIHRVGRTARAGRSGKSILMVTQYDVEIMLRIEHAIDSKLQLYPIDPEEVKLLEERVAAAGQLVSRELREAAKTPKKRGKSRTRDDLDRDDDIEEAGMPRPTFKRSRIK